MSTPSYDAAAASHDVPTVREPLTDLSATRIAELVRTGQVTAVEVVEAHLDRISEAEPWVRALVHVDRDGALEQAHRTDLRRAAGSELGALAGVPVVVKDNIDVLDQVTTSGSKAHGDVARVDAQVTRRLRKAGAVLLGRANMDELAMGASTQTSAYGRTHNPHDVRRSAGGSSGGSAAAVAAHEVPLSVGTDTGGSVREPASQCGVVGMAPSPGLLPMRGVVPFAPGSTGSAPWAGPSRTSRCSSVCWVAGPAWRRPPRTSTCGACGSGCSTSCAARATRSACSAASTRCSTRCATSVRWSCRCRLPLRDGRSRRT